MDKTTNALLLQSCVKAFSRLKKYSMWEYFYACMRKPKNRGEIPHDPNIQQRIISELQFHGFKLNPYRIDKEQFIEFFQAYHYEYLNLYLHGKYEKALQHFIAANLLNLSANDIIVDIASHNSCAHKIYSDFIGCKIYTQDIKFPEGIHGSRIGGSASCLPFEKNSVSKMSLHCSFEHFEGEEDLLFIQEAARVLRPGGKMCIIPLYLYEKYSIQTNPLYSRKLVSFDKDAELYCSKKWFNSYGRFYDVQQLQKRVLQYCGPLNLKIYVLENGTDIHHAIHTRFIGMLEKERL